jgi:hypothetical protein
MKYLEEKIKNLSVRNMNENGKQNKVILKTSKREIEFDEEEFNEFNHITATKIEEGEVKEVRILKLTRNKHIIMS